MSARLKTSEDLDPLLGSRSDLQEPGGCRSWKVHDKYVCVCVSVSQ